MIDLTACPQCGEPAEVLWRAVLYSTDGPIEHAKVACVRQHCFFMPTEDLPATQESSRADSPQHSAVPR